MIAEVSKKYVDGAISLVARLKNGTAGNDVIDSVVKQLAEEEEAAQASIMPIVERFESNVAEFRNHANNYRKGGAREFSKLAAQISEICKKDANSYIAMIEAVRDAQLDLQHYMAFREDVPHEVVEIYSVEDLDNLFSGLGSA